MSTASIDRIAESEKPPRPKRWIPLGLRIFFGIQAAAFLVGCVCLWYVVLRPMQIHSRAYYRLSESVQSLVHRRPAVVSKEEWSFIIAWTMNGIGNCCAVEQYLNRDEESHARFLTLPDRFDERLRGQVDLETIDWFWDELKAVSKHGPRYSDNWRPTTPDRLREAGSTNSGIVVD
jgi:hypothetical protein